MDKPEIIFENIESDEQYHRSTWQLKDANYQSLKDYLIEFYNSHSKDDLLYWIIEEQNGGKSPITFHYLDFVPCLCNCCDTVCEIPRFGGEIMINNKKYEYSGKIGAERWCESNDCMTSEIQSKYFLFDIFLDGKTIIDEDGRRIQFYQKYSKLEDFRINIFPTQSP